jgi:hypothetical protein
MTKWLQTGNRITGPTKRTGGASHPTRRVPVQREIRRLDNELSAFNERMAELEAEGHRGHAMDVLKANALDFARRIDEVRCLLIESAPRAAPKPYSRNLLDS